MILWNFIESSRYFLKLNLCGLGLVLILLAVCVTICLSTFVAKFYE